MCRLVANQISLLKESICAGPDGYRHATTTWLFQYSGFIACAWPQIIPAKCEFSMPRNRISDDMRDTSMSLFSRKLHQSTKSISPIILRQHQFQ